MHQLSKTIKELERWHGIFNRELFKGRLTENVVVTVQSTGRKRSLLGWHWSSRWQNKMAALQEINVVAESLRRPAELILETLLHEMCHQASTEAKRVDVSPGSQYHNGIFRKTAEEAGLVCTRASRVGWGMTELGYKALSVIRKHKPDRDAFTIVRLVDPTKEKRPQKHKKWICVCGPIRVGRAEFHARCLICKTDFEKVEDLDRTPFHGHSLVDFRRKHPYEPGQAVRVDGRPHRVTSWPFPRPDGRVGLMVVGPSDLEAREIILDEHAIRPF